MNNRHTPKSVKVVIASLSALLVVGYASAVIAYNVGRTDSKPASEKTVVHKDKVAKSDTDKLPTRSELLKLVNKERKEHNAPPLTEDSRLDQSAQMKADDMMKYHYFSHVNPNTGETSFKYILSTGIQCADTSENIRQNALDYSAKASVEAWIASPPHHKAMIDSKYTLTGFGISGPFVVEHFCQP